MRKILGFNPFELMLIAVVITTAAISLAASFTSGDLTEIGFGALELAAGAGGILSVVLCAKGKRAGFIFGLVNAAAYAYISFVTQYYGEVMLNALFYVPSNIVSFILWTRNENKQRTGEVQGRALTKPQALGWLAIVAAATIGYRMILVQLGGAMTFLDGFTTIASIAATALMLLRYTEQWVLWIAVDIVTVALWVAAGDPVMIVMWSAYLVNAVYGYLLWRYKQNKPVVFARALKLAAA